LSLSLQEVRVLAVTRYNVEPDGAGEFLDRARTALTALAAQRGYVRGSVGRAADDARRWVLLTEWVGVGAYRRALSSYDVKVAAVPLLSLADDEPTAYEVLAALPDEHGASARSSGRAADATTVGVGDASAPEVRTDLD
jgi:quinol monooxygenase YgiN